ncbi:hypothetical protein [Haloarchaeobius sp. DT45]
MHQYNWTHVSGPNVALSDRNVSEPTFDAPSTLTTAEKPTESS